MTRILIVDDDESQCNLLSMHLQTAGYDSEIAQDSLSALKSLVQALPDLVIADVSMPGVDGFGLLGAMRANAATAHLPFVFLAAMSPDSVLPRAVSLGVQEVLTKPLQRSALLSAVNRCLDPATGAADAGARVLDPGTTTRLQAENLFARDAAHASGTQHSEVRAAVLSAAIASIGPFMRSLSGTETAELLDTFLGTLVEHAHSHGGWVVRVAESGLLALFRDDGSGSGEHAAAALKCALKAVLSARYFQVWLRQRYLGHELPQFCISAGVHDGSALVCRLAMDHRAFVVGDGPETASALEKSCAARAWSVTVSGAAIAAAGARFVTGARASQAVTGWPPVEARELIGLAPRANSTAGDWRIYRQLAAALTENSAALASLRDSA